ncbi:MULTISPECIES: SHOCT domain-containing protein [unclassified Streptomyces]|uniref:SHOCT domain-containing protein n=1 Tax=unclassified Streptomyces TaxID=2593676 RepID=UPI000DDADFDB|nr:MULTISPECIES: SHOCT domain-containing protein [unclassified Streptomyces]QZZ31600.1 SHOCT domain-containing protein [Streptomyces sp. ST1015]
MDTLASGYGGPGPWILLFPLFGAAAVAAVVTVVRRTGGWRGRTRPGARPLGDAPLAVLGRRFAAGEIDEEEYWRRQSVLEEHFGRKGGDA